MNKALKNRNVNKTESVPNKPKQKGPPPIPQDAALHVVSATPEAHQTTSHQSEKTKILTPKLKPDARPPQVSQDGALHVASTTPEVHQTASQQSEKTKILTPRLKPDAYQPQASTVPPQTADKATQTEPSSENIPVAVPTGAQVDHHFIVKLQKKLWAWQIEPFFPSRNDSPKWLSCIKMIRAGVIAIGTVSCLLGIISGLLLSGPPIELAILFGTFIACNAVLNSFFWWVHRHLEQIFIDHQT